MKIVVNANIVQNPSEMGNTTKIYDIITGFLADKYSSYKKTSHRLKSGMILGRRGNCSQTRGISIKYGKAINLGVKTKIFDFGINNDYKIIQKFVLSCFPTGNGSYRTFRSNSKQLFDNIRSELEEKLSKTTIEKDGFTIDWNIERSSYIGGSLDYYSK